MGTIKAMFNPKDFKALFDAKAFDRDIKVADKLFEICKNIAVEAKNGHSYKNYKGELESSIGVVVLIDRSTLYKWDSSATMGTDPAKGISDINNVLSKYIVGKPNLPDGTKIPAKGVVGIVFAAAPYAKKIEDRKRKVLYDFVPAGDFIFKQIKMV